jgi:hypothetical protein
MSRAEAAGDQRAIQGKIAARYDPETEAEVIGWFKALSVNENLKPGMREVEKQLRNGQDLIKLAAAVQQGTPNCPEKAKKMRLKANTQNAPFKQMENVQTFVTFCENYGVPKSGTFQTVDLYEGRNMAQVLNCIQILGSECQRHGFQGPVIGPRPTEKNVREFSEEQMAAGKSIIGLQAGSNKGASQSGMRMGGVRHVADIKADDMDKSGQGVIGLQMGSNKGASQSGMSMGGGRHASDQEKTGVEMDKAGHSMIGLQMGSNKGASQSGMSMGAVRHVADIRADDMDKSGQGVIGLQAGSNKGASQKGMSFGASRHGADIRADDMVDKSTLSLQYGSNKGASQSGMSMGGQRHVADIKVDGATREGSSVIGLQMGSNKGASQAGMTMGGVRHGGDIRVDQMDQSSQGVTNLQYGSNTGANQSGMSMGGHRKM